ncbi:MAG: ABC transporter substrate-binding protein [Chloroflexi bacterium]|nr:ABC transporter substrate-binding protein [Chloroflexota bacterium]
MRVRVKLTSSLALATGTFLVALACAPAAQPTPQSGGPQEVAQPKSGGVLNLVQTLGDPPSFDTHQESTGATTQSVHPSHDNLVRFDWFEPEKIVPDLAEKWDVSADGRTYTFVLRKGVKFHNGDPFTSADVQFTLDRVMNPPKGMVSPRRDQFSAITSIETPDDSTVKITVKRPNPSLLAALSQGVLPIYDKKWIEAKGNDIPKKEINGTGPFKMKEYIRGVSIESERNPDYWVKGRPYLGGVKSYYITDPNTAMAAFRTGQVVMHSLEPGSIKQIKDELSDRVGFYPSEGEGFTALIPNSKRKPWSEPKVREALNLVIDRPAFIQVLRSGEGTVGAYMKISGAWGLPQEELLKLPGYGKDKAKDIERAKQLMAEAGLGAGMDVVILTRKLQSYIDTAVLFQDQLKKIGLNGTVKSYETSEAYDLIRKADYDLISWGFGYSLEDPDAVYGEFVVCNAPRNWGYACTPEVDALFEKQSQELDIAKRQALVREMERKAITSNAMILTHRSIGTTALYNYVKGYKPHAATRNNQRFVEVWLDR